MRKKHFLEYAGVTIIQGASVLMVAALAIAAVSSAVEWADDQRIPVAGQIAMIIGGFVLVGGAFKLVGYALSKRAEKRDA